MNNHKKDFKYVLNTIIEIIVILLWIIIIYDFYSGDVIEKNVFK